MIFLAGMVEFGLRIKGMKRNFVHGLMLAAVCGLLAGILRAESATAATVNSFALSPELSQKLEAYAQEGMKKWHSPGLAIGMVKDDQLVWQGYFGYSDIKEKKPVSESTVFRIGSISKTFTAIAIMQLWEQGKFQLSDPVSKYTPFPLFRNQSGCCPDPTLLNIFTHTSGGGEVKRLQDAPKFFRDFYDDTNLQPRKSFAELFRNGIQTRICPGSKWAYCNYCVGSLGMVVEQITGQSFHNYTDEHLFHPLGMSSSSFYETDQTQANLAIGYRWQERKKAFQPDRVSFLDTDVVAAGNVYSTVPDMSRYMSALLNGGKLAGFSLLKKQILDLMWTAQYQTDPRLPAMGIIFILENQFGHRLVWHNGGMPGFTSSMILAPDDHLGVVVLNNAMSAAPDNLALGILKILFHYQPAEKKISSPEESLKKLTGNYVSSQPDFLTDLRFLMGSLGVLKVRMKKGGLVIAFPGKPLALEQVDPEDPYFFRIVDKENESENFVVFKPGEDGKARSILFGLNEFVRPEHQRREICPAETGEEKKWR